MKIIVDVLMLVILLLVFSRGYIDPIFHEILGIFFLILFIIHLFLNISNIYIVNLHKMFSYITLIFISIHLGINFNLMFMKLKKKLNKFILLIINLLFIIYGIYSFIKLDIVKHIIGGYGFSVWDSNIIINIFRYLSLIMSISIVINYLYNFLKSIDFKYMKKVQN